MFIPALIALCCLGAALLFPLFLFVWVALHRSRTRTGPHQSLNKRSAAVVVLGDVGRSPRMCYHAESLANEGWKVGLVGYAGTSLPPPLQRPSVKSHSLPESPRWFAKLPKAAFIVVAPLKIFIQSTSLFWALAVQVHPPPELILVQTPPALPTLFIVRLVAALLGARIIIDWHNLGYTILGLRLGASHPLVRLAAWLERWTGRRAFAHLFVTHAMRRHLDAQWKLRGYKAVLHDRPPVHFRRSHTHETHTLFNALAPRLQPALNDFLPSYRVPLSTPFTTQSSAKAEALLRADRPALAVSSTSWTADEDFDILLEAARKYECRAQRLSAQASTSTSAEEPASSSSLAAPLKRLSTSSASSSSSHAGNNTIHAALSPGSKWTNIDRLPKLLIIVTGKGQLRAHYERLIATAEREERWKFVRIRTAWLEVEEYPILLGSADIGISLHSSSSGLDLPMKVVDMLGCGLPVLALNFPCLPELISDGRNGLVFSSAGQLADQLAEVVHSGVRASSGGASDSSVEAAGAGNRRNWMVRAMEEDESLAFGWGDEPPEAIVAAASARAAAGGGGGDGDGGSGSGGSRLTTLRWGAGGGLPTHSGNSGTSTPLSLPRESTDSPPLLSMNGSPVLDSPPSGSRPWFGSTDSSRGLRRQSARAKKVATWTGNWRRVVRPLLNASSDASEDPSGSHQTRSMISAEQANAERRKRKLERAKRKGKGTSIHHRKGLFGNETRQDEDYLLHNSDDDDDDSEGDDGLAGGNDGREARPSTEVLASSKAAGPSQLDGLSSRRHQQRTKNSTNFDNEGPSSRDTLTAISVPDFPPTPGSERRAFSSLLVLPSSSSSSAPSIAFSPDSPSSPLSVPHAAAAANRPHSYLDGTNSEPLSPASPISGSGHAYSQNALQVLGGAHGSGGGGGGDDDMLRPRTSDADKRWRRRRTYSGSSSLYVNTRPSSPVGGSSASALGIGNGHGIHHHGGETVDGADSLPALKVEVGGEFVTPFDLGADDESRPASPPSAAAMAAALGRSRRRGSHASGLGTAAAAEGYHQLQSPPSGIDTSRSTSRGASLPLHSPLASPIRQAGMVLLPATPSSLGSVGAGEGGRSASPSPVYTVAEPEETADLSRDASQQGDAPGSLPARQLDSNWSPEAIEVVGSERVRSHATRGMAYQAPPRKSWSAGEGGEVPDIRVFHS